MYVRKKRNRSGSISVVIVSKHSGRYKEIKSIGVSSNESEIEALYREGLRWIKHHLGYRDLFEEFEQEETERHIAAYFLDNVENVMLNGVQQILDPVYTLIGFDRINDTILKQLVISRISQPLSKSATSEYLKSHFDEDIEVHTIYRYLDKLNNTLQDAIQLISVEHTRKILGGKISLVFYDVTYSKFFIIQRIFINMLYYNLIVK